MRKGLAREIAVFKDDISAIPREMVTFSVVSDGFCVFMTQKPSLCLHSCISGVGLIELELRMPAFVIVVVYGNNIGGTPMNDNRNEVMDSRLYDNVKEVLELARSKAYEDTGTVPLS